MSQTAKKRRASPKSQEPCARTSDRTSGCLDEEEWIAVSRELALSPRQLQIVRCVLDGLEETQIGEELGVSPHTVHSHLDRLYKKVGVGSRCELTVRVFVTYLTLLRRGKKRGAYSPTQEAPAKKRRARSHARTEECPVDVGCRVGAWKGELLTERSHG